MGKNALAAGFYRLLGGSLQSPSPPQPPHQAGREAEG